MGQGQSIKLRTALLMGSVVFLAGCLDANEMVTRGANLFSGMGASDSEEGVAEATPAVLDSEMEDGTQSPIIEGLLNRRSVLENGSSYDQVAQSVLAANSRAAEADLRAARLRAEARAHNWLPTLGPSISLSSLGDLVTSLVVEQVLFDNGRNRAERDFAKADVEVAAVVLATDTNNRVLTALDLYLTAEQAREHAEIYTAALTRLDRFEYVLSERVRGGVSDRADLLVLQQKITGIRADITTRNQAAATAMAELSAMSATPLDGVRGLADVAAVQPNVQPLSVMKAQAESARAIASATAARAGFFPGVSLNGSTGSGGGRAGIGVSTPNGIGFGMGASVRAIEAEEQAAAARVGQTREDANRSLRSLEQQLAALELQAGEKQRIAQQAATNLALFDEQYREGQRPVMDVIGVFETKLGTEAEAAAVRFSIARLRLSIASELGALVQGEQI